MNRHKKTHPTAATVERVEAGAGLAGASTSDSQSTTSAPPGQAVKIADLLGHGQSAAVPLRHLKELAGLLRLRPWPLRWRRR